jgi:hypothetical protein
MILGSERGMDECAREGQERAGSEWVDDVV